MYAHKLILGIKKLNRKEMTRFKEFAFSPYFNKHEDVRRLVDLLSQNFPNFEGAKWERKALFQHVFPNAEYDQGKLAIIFTYTMRLFERFLVEEQFKGKRGYQQIWLLETSRERQYYNLYEKALTKTKNFLQDLPHQDSRNYLLKFHLAQEADNYFNQINKQQKDWNIEEKQRQLDYFFIAEKLKDATEMYVRRKILKVDYEPELLELVLQEVKGKFEQFQHIPPISIYYRVYNMVSSNNPAIYHEALEDLKKQESNFDSNELKLIYNYFQNFCIGQINSGNQEFLAALFNLYQLQLERELIIEDDYLSEWHYKNIVTTGIRLNEMRWVKEFIESYRIKLHPDSRANAYRFNLASYYYYAKQYDKVLELLTKVEYSDLRYNVSAKAILLRTYYDLEEYDALYSLADSFRQYLHRSKLLADRRRQGHANLFKLTKKAAQLRYNLPFYSSEKGQKEWHRLQQEIQETASIFNRKWLEERVEEIRKLVQ